MIAYFDTSALVPLVIEEPTSEACRRVWDDADDAVTCRLSYVETAAELAQAKRLGRLSARGQRAALIRLDGLWLQLQIAEVDQLLVERAAVIADAYGLRGYDAVHCASAEVINDEAAIAVSGDRQLLTAWHRLGLSTYSMTR